MSGEVTVLVAVSLAFAWSMGAHYTGAVMGMPYAVRAIHLWPALICIAVLTVIGATVASRGVQPTVGLHIIDAGRVDARMATIIMLGAFALTTAYTYDKVPTSTIQILIFCVVGTGVAAGAPVHWATIARLAVLWVLAPPVACALGFAGAGLARGRQTVKRSVLIGILRGWAIRPITGFTLCFTLDKLMAATIGGWAPIPHPPPRLTR
ncbi:MAG TPA: inorganic phosphate transporter [Chloroflexota bacterium]|nr:inorganic phosphate transporter [Chloroflexota bacterium]